MEGLEFHFADAEPDELEALIAKVPVDDELTNFRKASTQTDLPGDCSRLWPKHRQPGAFVSLDY